MFFVGGGAELGRVGAGDGSDEELGVDISRTADGTLSGLPGGPGGWSACSWPSHHGHRKMPLSQFSLTPGALDKMSRRPVARTTFRATRVV
jgi:hypothetical protein